MKKNVNILLFVFGGVFPALWPNFPLLSVFNYFRTKKSLKENTKNRNKNMAWLALVIREREDRACMKY